jgi:hypothetical protein
MTEAAINIPTSNRVSLSIICGLSALLSGFLPEGRLNRMKRTVEKPLAI